MILTYGQERNLPVKSKAAINSEHTKIMNKGKSWKYIKGEKKRQEKTTSQYQSIGFTTEGWQNMPPQISHFGTGVILS